MTVDAGAASIYGTKKLKIVAKDPASVPFQIDFQFGWSYQRVITVTNTGAAITDYQVSFTFDTAALITAGKMQSAGQDIRVTDSDTTTQIPFWVETGTINTTTTKIWVKVPSIPNGTKSIYLYYGNLYAGDVMNAANTFIFFDNFLDLSKWTVTGNPSIVSGEVTMNGSSYNGNGITSIITIPRPAIIEWDSRSTSSTSIETWEGYSVQPLNYASGLSFARQWSGSLTRYLDGATAGAWTWTTAKTHQKINLKPTQGYTIFWDNIQKEDSASWSTDNNKIVFQCRSATGALYISNVRARKYVATEPSTSVGVETGATSGIGSTLQNILKVAESSGNLGLRVTSPANILTVQQGSLTDPIADSWTTWPCDRTTKTILRELTGPEALPELAKIRLYEWKKKPRRDDITLPKFQAARIGMMIDDPEVPARILAYDMYGKLQGIDLLAYVGFLHVSMKELSVKVAALEAKLPP